MMMCRSIINYRTMNAILEIEFDDVTSMRELLEDSASNYEGYIKQRVGYNFPTSFIIGYIPGVNKHHKYVVGYLKGDYKTKNHEMCHALFHCDPNYNKKWVKAWNSLNKNMRRKIEKKLQYMGYPEHLWVDEWQAYSQDRSGLFKSK